MKHVALRLNGIFIGLLAMLMTASVAAAQPASQPARADAQVFGRVLDDKGNPVASAEVMIMGPNGERAMSDAGGNYSFSKLPGGSYRIGVTADGFLPIDYYRSDAMTIAISAKSHVQRDLTLQRGILIRVAVTDLLGGPVPDADVDLCTSDRSDRGQSLQRKQTSRGGYASFAVKPSATPYLVTVSMNDHEPTHQDVVAKSIDEPQEVELTLLPATPIKGIAICSDGKPASGWKISAAPQWWVSNYIPREESIDKDGNFTLSEVGPGSYSLTIWKGNSGTVPIAAHFPPTSQPYRLDLPFVSPASLVTLSGRVHITGGRPDYVSVNASGPGSDWNNGQVNFNGGRVRSRTATQPAGVDGTFKIPDMKPGVYQIRFESPTIEPKTLDNVKVPGDLPTVELKVITIPHFRGTVTDAATGKPITSFKVRLHKVSSIGNGPNYVPNREWSAIESADGKFDLEVTGPGVYKADVAAPDYAQALSADAKIESGPGAAPLDIKLTTGGMLSGLVVDPSGAPVAGAKVIPLSTTRIDAPNGEPLFGGDMGSAVTNAQGHFSLQHLAAGEESIKITSDRFAPQVAKGFAISEGQTADAGTVKLLAGGVVEGTVYDDHGNTASGVEVRFQENYGYFEEEGRKASLLGIATTDASGHYRIDRLPQQTIYVEPGDWNQKGVRRRLVRPNDGKTTRLDFGGPTPIKGRLMIAGKAASNAPVELAYGSEYFGSLMVTTTTDAEGRFTFFGPPSGKYTLFYQPSGERSQYTVAKEGLMIGEQAMDLGDVSIDTGRVTVTVQADDPADAKGLRYGSITPDQRDRPYVRSVAQLQRDAGSDVKWISQEVPAGKLRAFLQGTPPNSIGYSAAFERAAGAADTTVTVHVPKSSAQLTIKFTGTLPESYRGQRFAMLKNTDSTLQAYLSTNQDAPLVVKLPPATYQVMDNARSRPREDVQPIELKDGDSKEMEIPLLANADGVKRSVNITLWTSDGLQVLDATAHLIDANGKAVDSTGPTDTGLYYFVPPGHYRTTVDRPGAPTFISDVDVPEAKDSKSRTAVKIDLTLP